MLYVFLFQLTTVLVFFEKVSFVFSRFVPRTLLNQYVRTKLPRNVFLPDPRQQTVDIVIHAHLEDNLSPLSNPTHTHTHITLKRNIISF